MYEHSTEPLLPMRRFLVRLASSATASLLLVVPSLAVGMWGYRFFERMDWLDAFLNASMLLGGWGRWPPRSRQEASCSRDWMPFTAGWSLSPSPVCC